MKKIFLILGLFTLIMANLSFRKFFSDKNINSREQLKLNKRPTEHNWSVNEYGFLVFPSVTDLEEFKNFVTRKTHAQIQQYLQDSLGFSSLGASKYSTSSAGTVSEEEAIDYVMNASRIFQTDGIIFRPVGPRDCIVNWEFVLTMTPANLNSTSYGYLESGVYDANTMNKFATDPVTETTSISTFMAQTPSGYEETDANSCPGGGDLPVAYRPVYNANTMNKFITDPVTEITPRGPFMVQTSSAYEERNPNSSHSGGLLREHRPFWGWSQATCTPYHGTECWDPITNTEGTCYTYCPPMYYIFWIRVNNNGGCTAMQNGAPCPPVQ